MTMTPHLGLPLLAAAQAQKHVTHNEALLALDALVHCAIRDKDLSSPPGSPAEGDRYIVGPAPTGLWAGKASLIVLRQDGAWLTITPQIGFIAYVVDEALLYVFTSGGWRALTDALTAIQNLGRLGVGTTADAANPFSAKLNAALWTAREAGEGGTGDLRYTLNKESTANVLSLLFQTGYSGRLEIGLVGSDNLVAKVSANGTTWRQALAVDAGTGAVDVLSPEATIASAATVDLGAQSSRRLAITGMTTITSFGSAPDKERILRFVGVLTLNHNGTTLNLRNGGQNILTAAGDIAHVASDAAGNWSVLGYWPAKIGRSLVYSGTHTAGDGNAAPRGFSSGDTATISGALAGYQYVTSIRDVGNHGAQMSVSDTADGVYVRRLSGGTWQPWRQVAELGSSTIATFGRLQIGTTTPTLFHSIQHNGRVLNVRGDTASFGYAISGVVLQAAIDTQASSENLILTGTNVYVGTNLAPTSDNARALGSPTLRWSTLYAGTGTINTSDAREKTPVGPLTPAEIAWSRDLAAEIGGFQFLSSVEEKGPDIARRHIGLTVQRAVELGEPHGLDPFRYAFICRDAWEAEPGRPALEAVAAILDEAGREISPARPAQPELSARPAGDRYAFRPDQLALFIARGQEARLAALEEALAA